MTDDMWRGWPLITRDAGAVSEATGAQRSRKRRLMLSLSPPKQGPTTKPFGGACTAPGGDPGLSRASGVGPQALCAGRSTHPGLKDRETRRRRGSQALRNH